MMDIFAYLRQNFYTKRELLSGVLDSLYGGGGGVGFNDSEGDPANVASAAADGSSANAARRDHVHTIGAGVVTAGMLADSYASASHTHAGALAGVSLITEWNYRTSSRSLTAYAWKGNEFKADADVILYALGYFGGLVAGATYKGAVMTGTGSPGNIATISFTASYTVGASPASTDGGYFWMEFATPVTLTAGTTYGLMLGRTDGSDTYILPIPANGSVGAHNAVPMPGQSHGNNWRIPKANPAVGDAITRVAAGDSYGMGFRYRFPGSSY